MSSAQAKVRSGTRPRGTLNHRWNEVLQVASEVFTEKGYLAATLQDIASRLGMLKGSLYYYIDSKEDLLYEILCRAHQEGIAFVEEDAATSRGDPRSRVAALIRRWMEGIVSPPSSPSILESEFDHRYLDPERREVIRSLRAQITKAAEDIVAQGVGDGSFHPSVDPYTAACSLLRSLNTTRRWYAPESGQTWQQVIDWMVGLYLAGLTQGPTSFGRPEGPVEVPASQVSVPTA